MTNADFDITQHLPGISNSSRLEKMIRVDHAGEFGAVRIYDGQLAILRNRPGTDHTVSAIEKMAKQEQEHLETFDRLVIERRVRPTLLAPLWNEAGFVLGAVTALVNEKAAMACTAAVEEVIDEHYARQERALGRLDDPELAGVVESFRADEQDHRATAIDAGAEGAPAYTLLTNVIKAACRFAIRASERI